MADIFISYSSVDRPSAQRLAAALEREGWSVWWDRVIPPGRKFAEVIKEQLDSAGCVLVLWSETAIDSDWVHREARSGKCKLIPVLIHNVEPPFEFDDIHAAPLMDWEDQDEHLGYRRLIEAIAGRVGRPPREERESEEARQRAEHEAERRAKEEAAQKEAEAEAERRAEVEEARKQAEEQSKAEGEAARIEAEREAHRKAEEEDDRQAAEEEAKRKASEQEARQRAVDDAGRREAEAPPPKRNVWTWTAVAVITSILAAIAISELSKPAVEPSPGQTFKDCGICPEMVVVPAGSFTMGSPPGEKERGDDEGPQHRVTIAEPFAVGKYEVTFTEWDACIDGGGCDGYRPTDSWGRGSQPVIAVSWQDARSYVKWLSDKTGEDYRLLSEAEWEYAARAETTTPFYFGRAISPDQANYNGDYAYDGGPKGVYRGKTVPVGSFPANAFGLYDVHGNVWEWVTDCYQGDAYKTHKNYPAMIGGWQDSCNRVVRGGSWYSGPRTLRSAYRYWFGPVDRVNNVGFRVARTL
jgi:formylglycine-generating enzyme required for sulfatase activity